MGDYAFFFKTLLSKYGRNAEQIGDYFNWAADTTDTSGTQSDYAKERGVLCRGKTIVFNGDEEPLETTALFFGPRGILYEDASRRMINQLFPLKGLSYECEEGKYSTFLCVKMFRFSSHYYKGFGIYNRQDRDSIIEFIEQRNTFTKKITENVVCSFLELYDGLKDNEELLNSVANFCDLLPNSLFITPAAYYLYLYKTADSFFESFIIPRGVDKDSYLQTDISSFDLNSITQLSMDFDEFIETEFKIPKWAVHTISYALIRKEFASRAKTILRTEYGLDCNYDDFSVYLKQCLENGSILADDTVGLRLLAWDSQNSESLWSAVFEKYTEIDEIVKIQKTSDRKNSLFASLKNPRNTTKVQSDKQGYTIDDIDLMTGTEFESVIAGVFRKMGFEVTLTKSSGDQGIDVIAEKGVQRIGIQAKCYSGSVGNAAIQEAVAGKAYYNLTKVMVITNSKFTDSAIALAQSNNVVLWDRSILAEKLSYS